MMECIDTEEGLSAAAARIRASTLVAADTEAAGYHRFRDRICLLQLSTRTETFVVDTLALSHLRPLEAPLADPAVEVIFHDADYDLRLLDRDFGVRVRGLFDTKIAAQFLGEPAIGLGSLIERRLGVQLEKKYQRADWAQRPLPPALLAYAAMDTCHLPALRDILRAELEHRGRLAWAEEEFRLHEAPVASDRVPAEEAYLRLKGARELRPRQLAALRELYAWREALGLERDVASFRIASNEALIELSRRLPETEHEAAALPAVPRSLLARYGRQLLEVLGRVRALPDSELPRRPRSTGRRPPDPEFEALVDRLKVARDQVAEALGLDRGFLLPRHQLEEIARQRPVTTYALSEVPGMRRWQVEAVGEAVLAALAHTPQGSKPSAR